MRSTALLALVFLLLGGCECARVEPVERVGAREWRSVHVVDGDTLDISDGEIEVRVRLLCVNTPERGQPGYREARDFLASRIEGRVLPLETRPRLRALLRLMRDQADVEREPFVFGGPAPLAINSRRDVRTEGKGRSLKRALSVVRKNSGGDWALKSLRSTTATHLCNADLYRGNTYNVASEMGHRHDVLLSKYAKQFALPKDRAKAKSIEGALGIDDVIAAWLKAQAGAGGKLIKLRSA